MKRLHCRRVLRVFAQIFEWLALVIKKEVLNACEHREGYEVGKEAAESSTRETIVGNAEGGEGHRLEGATAEKAQGLFSKDHQREGETRFHTCTHPVRKYGFFHIADYLDTIAVRKTLHRKVLFQAHRAHCTPVSVS